MFHLLALAWLAFTAIATPIAYLSARQVIAMSQTSPSSSSSTESVDKAVPLSAIIAVSTVLGLGIVLTLLVRVSAIADADYSAPTQAMAS